MNIDNVKTNTSLIMMKECPLQVDPVGLLRRLRPDHANHHHEPVGGVGGRRHQDGARECNPEAACNAGSVGKAKTMSVVFGSTTLHPWLFL